MATALHFLKQVWSSFRLGRQCEVWTLKLVEHTAVHTPNLRSSGSEQGLVAPIDWNCQYIKIPFNNVIIMQFPPHCWVIMILIILPIDRKYILPQIQTDCCGPLPELVNLSVFLRIYLITEVTSTTYNHWEVNVLIQTRNKKKSSEWFIVIGWCKLCPHKESRIHIKLWLTE